MHETQKTITDWAVNTFGYPKNILPLVDRVLKESDELKQLRDECFKYNDMVFEKIADECADIYITMCNLMGTMGYDLQACVNHKMQINRGRKWKLNGDGTGQHIKEGTK